MNIDRPAVLVIAAGWHAAHEAINAAAKKASLEAGDDWAPAVRGAVTAYTTAWHHDLLQLGAEARRTADGVEYAGEFYRVTDDEVVESMKTVQLATAPGG